MTRSRRTIASIVLALAATLGLGLAGAGPADAGGGGGCQYCHDRFPRPVPRDPDTPRVPTPTTTPEDDESDDDNNGGQGGPIEGCDPLKDCPTTVIGF